MLNDILMWNKIGRIIIQLAERLNIEPKKALDLFYSLKTNQRLHDEHDFLNTMSDQYIVDETIFELQGR